MQSLLLQYSDHLKKDREHRSVSQHSELTADVYLLYSGEKFRSNFQKIRKHSRLDWREVGRVAVKLAFTQLRG